MIYSELTQRYFEAAADRAGTLAEPQVLRGEAGSIAQGTWVRFEARAGAGGRLEEARFLAFGCPHVIAICAWIVEQSIGAPPQSTGESVQALRERFGVPYEKLGRLLVVEDAWLACVGAPSETATEIQNGAL